VTRASIVALACAAAVSAGCGGKNDTDQYQTGAAGESRGILGGDSVEAFVDRAAISNMAEVQLGQLAAERAQSPQVREFAEHVVTDHQQALDQLREAATASNLLLPSALNEKHRDLHHRLSQLQGAEFDREYMSAMVDAHEESVDLLEDQAPESARSGDADGVGHPMSGPSGSEAPGPDRGASEPATGTETGARADDSSHGPVKRWAAQTLPHVREHLEQARQIKEQLEEKD
jgi:predicted outer membrane protein